MRLSLKGAAVAASIAGALFMGVGDAFAQAQDILNKFDRMGPFQVRVMSSGGSTFYVPQGPDARDLGIVGWGNGTGGNQNTYRGMLTQVASFGVIVAAANTANSGSGGEIVNAVETAMTMFSDQIAANPRICTAGHSQGGGGANNAAIMLNNDCIINVESDTRFTVRITGPTPEGAESLIICGTGDTLAPCQGGNEANIRRMSRGPVALVLITGISHFEPVGDGGDVSKYVAAFAASRLRDDALAMEARSLFVDGPNAISPESVRELTRAQTLKPESR